MRATWVWVTALALGLCAQQPSSPPKPVEDPEDPGRPKLKRGGPAPRVKNESRPERVPSRAPYREIVTDVEGKVVADSATEAPPESADLITRARHAAFEFSQQLPNFLCDEYVLRYTSETKPPNWKLRDRVQLELMYIGGKEDYRNIRRNGKPLKKGSPEDSGAWSTGEFGSILLSIMSRNSAAKFTPKGPSTAAGLTADVYNYRIEKANSNWEIRFGTTVKPAYTGSLWIDPKTARTLRIEMSTRELPPNYDFDLVESTVDYGWVLISGEKYLLPTRSENLSCRTGTYLCSKNEIEFRNYRKFTTESQILQVESEISFPETEEKKPESAPAKKKKK